MEGTVSKGYVYQFGRYRLDPNERTLFANGEALRLPAKEFDTLLLFVENNGRALSKDQMMGAIWQDAFVEEGSLAKQVSRLRKIFENSEDVRIETIPKHGYRFSADLRRAEVPASSITVEKHTVKRVTVAYEVKDDTASGQASAAKPSSARWKLAAAAVLAALVLGAVFTFTRRTGSIGSTGVKTIAVLPLRSLNGEGEMAELGLGLTDSLITKLGTLKLAVRPIGAVTPFARAEDPAEVGRKLNVDAVVEGTLQRADGRLRVNVRLLGTGTGEQLWSESFEQQSAGIFALQDALSASITRALAFELTRSDNEQLLRYGTENAEAYEKYLRGRFYQTQNTVDGLRRSIELYEQALALDSGFAEAHAGIADAYLIQYNLGIKPAAETIPKARESLQRTLQLNPELSGAYSSLALIQFLIDRNWPESEQSLKRAIELNQNNADAFLRYGYFLTNLGRFDEGIEKLEAAREMNPLSGIIQADIGIAHLFARRYPEAIDHFEKTAAENPKFSLPHWLSGIAHEALGDNEKSFASNMTAIAIDDETEGGKLSRKLLAIREQEGVEAANRYWLGETIKARTQENIPYPALYIAERAATVKDRNQTLTWLEKAIDEGDPRIQQIRYLAKFDFLRDDVRFRSLAEKLPYREDYSRP